MRYLKLYENFIETELGKPKVELSDKTIDDVLQGKLFDDEEDVDKDDSVFIDKKGVYHIKNWNIY